MFDSGRNREMDFFSRFFLNKQSRWIEIWIFDAAPFIAA